jgi:hypothetical protein
VDALHGRATFMSDEGSPAVQPSGRQCSHPSGPGRPMAVRLAVIVRLSSEAHQQSIDSRPLGCSTAEFSQRNPRAALGMPEQEQHGVVGFTGPKLRTSGASTTARSTKHSFLRVTLYSKHSEPTTSGFRARVANVSKLEQRLMLVRAREEPDS